MADYYHLRIKQLDKPEAVLAFPSPGAYMVKKLFKPQYDNPIDFFNDFENFKPSMLEAIAAGTSVEKEVLVMLSIRTSCIYLSFSYGIKTVCRMDMMIIEIIMQWRECQF